MNTITKETKFSLNDVDNYKKVIDSPISSIIDKCSYLIIEYLKFIFENITIKNKEYARFVIIRGFNTIINVFRNLLFYTKNLDLTYFHCQKSFYFYVEFVGQILEDDKTFLQLTSRDATIYVYKKTIYEVNNEIKKKTIISQNCSDKLTILNSYIQICYSYLNKICDKKDFLLEKTIFVGFIETNINNLNNVILFNSFSLNVENLHFMEKIIDNFSLLVTEPNDFFELCNILLKKIIQTPNNIKKIYEKINKSEQNKQNEETEENQLTNKNIIKDNFIQLLQ
jgi:hypothetical protein